MDPKGVAKQWKTTAPLPKKPVDDTAPRVDTAATRKRELDDDHIDFSLGDLPNGKGSVKKLDRVLADVTRGVGPIEEDLGTLVESFVDPPVKAPAESKIQSLDDLLKGLEGLGKKADDLAKVPAADQALQKILKENPNIDLAAILDTSKPLPKAAAAESLPAKTKINKTPPTLADALKQVDEAYKNCTKNAWSLDSQVNYLEAARVAVSTYEKIAPQDPYLKTLRQLESDIARDVKKLQESAPKDSIRIPIPSTTAEDEIYLATLVVQEAMDKIYKNAPGREDLLPNMSTGRKLAIFEAALIELELAKKALTPPVIGRPSHPLPKSIKAENAQKAIAALERAEASLKAAEKGIRAFPSMAAISLPAGLMEHIAKAKAAAAADLDVRLDPAKPQAAAAESVPAKPDATPKKITLDAILKSIENLKKQADALSEEAAANEALKNILKQNPDIDLAALLDPSKPLPKTATAEILPAKPPAKKTPPTLADARKQIEDAFKKGASDGWPFASRLKYLEAARAAVEAYKEVAPEDPYLETLQDFERLLARDVNKQKERSIRTDEADKPLTRTDVADKPLTPRSKEVLALIERARGNLKSEQTLFLDPKGGLELAEFGSRKVDFAGRFRQLELLAQLVTQKGLSETLLNEIDLRVKNIGSHKGPAMADIDAYVLELALRAVS